MNMEAIKVMYMEYMKNRKTPKETEIPVETIEKKSDK